MNIQRIKFLLVVCPIKLGKGGSYGIPHEPCGLNNVCVSRGLNSVCVSRGLDNVCVSQSGLKAQ